MKMVFTLIITKQLLLILFFCSATWATCKKKVVPDPKTKVVVFESLPEHSYNNSLSTSYDAAGLQPLFNLANKFMDAVQGKNFGEVFKNENIRKLFGKNWKKLIMDFELPIAITIGIGLLFFLLMPLTGFCFCCCRCCGNCGGDMKQSEKYASQHCKVAMMVFFLFTCMVLMLCGVLFMFVTNDRLHDSYENVPKTFDSAIDEVDVMANNIIKDVNILTTDQVDCISDVVTDHLQAQNLKKVIGDPLYRIVNDNVSTIIKLGTEASQNITQIVATLNDVVAKKNDLVSAGTKLDGILQSITNDISDIKTTCQNLSLNCGDLGSINLGSVAIDYNSLPNMTEYLSQMKKVEDLQLGTKINEAKKVVEDIPQTVVNKSSAAVSNVINIIKDSKAKIRQGGDKIKDEIRKKVSGNLNKFRTNGVEGKKIMNEYTTSKKFERIRWIVYVALSAVMAFIVFIIFCGLSCGSCGYKKEYMPTERSAASNCGGRLLMAAVGLMFLFSFIFMIFCVVWFAVGMHVHIFCREIKNGDFVDNVIFRLVNDDSLKNISVRHALSQCRKNKAVYRAATDFIEEKFNITKQLDVDVMKMVNKKIEEIDFDFSTIDLMHGADTVLNDLLNSKIDNINFTNIFSTLKQSVNSTDLGQVITKLDSSASSVNNSGVVNRIRKISTNVTTVKDVDIPKVTTAIDELNKAAIKLQAEVKSIKDTGRKVLVNLKASQQFLQTTTKDEIKSRIKVLASDLTSWVDQGIKHLLSQVKDNFAKCKPVANIYDGLVNTFYCDNLVQNANGFWLSLGWCLLFFIPSIIFCVKLAKYFRKMDYSPGMDTIVVDHPPYNDKIPSNAPYNAPGYSNDMRPPPPYTSTQRINPGYQHV